MRKRAAAYGTTERVNLWVILGAFVVFVLGGGIFYACHFDSLWERNGRPEGSDS